MQKLLLVNVLTPEYYGDCHIRGSINVPLDMIEEWAKSIDKDAPIVVYCASYTCSASLIAWQRLHALGFINIWAYEGGMNEWYNAGLPVEGTCSQSYLNEPVECSDEQYSYQAREIDVQELKKMIADASNI